MQGGVARQSPAWLCYTLGCQLLLTLVYLKREIVDLFFNVLVLIDFLVFYIELIVCFCVLIMDFVCTRVDRFSCVLY